MRKTTPSLDNFEYPSDAEAHFLEVNRSMDKHYFKGLRYHYAAGYNGPWVENHWINHFSALWNHRKNGTRLQDIFGPYIPILAPWVDTWMKHSVPPAGMIEDLRRVLRPNVLYISLSQNDQGLIANHKVLKMSDIPNLLVLSAGGYGHVPVPLLKAQEPLVNSDFSSREYFVSYMGSLNHGWMRGQMHRTVLTWARTYNLSTILGHNKSWRHVRCRS